MEERIVSKMDDALNLIMQRVQDSLEVKLGLKTAPVLFQNIDMPRSGTGQAAEPLLLGVHRVDAVCGLIKDLVLYES